MEAFTLLIISFSDPSLRAEAIKLPVLVSVDIDTEAARITFNLKFPTQSDR